MTSFAAEVSSSGSFERQEDAFRDGISSEPGARFTPEPGRYHLYISLACPWACRTLIVRHLKGLDGVVSASVVDPVRFDAVYYSHFKCNVRRIPM